MAKLAGVCEQRYHDRLRPLKGSEMTRRPTHNRKRLTALLLIPAGLAGMTALAPDASASHSWGGYHWARTANPFTIKLVNTLSGDWSSYLTTTSVDWSKSTVLKTTIVVGSAKNVRNCRATAGQVTVCNGSYGQNGWLGLAQIWLSSTGHITQGTTQMNDTYFKMAAYNNVSEKNHVMCQEVGHTFGLGHQDETGATLGTCMDYSTSTTSQKPNAHDYAMLESIYNDHLDTTNTTASSTASSLDEADNIDHSNPNSWGRRVDNGKSDLSEIYEVDTTDGGKIVTFVNKAKNKD